MVLPFPPLSLVIEKTPGLLSQTDLDLKAELDVQTLFDLG